jgi:dihydrofolate synthase/folylpolyglutamate synthase
MAAAALGARAAEIFGPDRVLVVPVLPDAIDVAVRLADEAGPGAGIFLAGSVALAGQARTLLAHPE